MKYYILPFFLFIPLSLNAQHGHWTDKYFSVDNIKCCSIGSDCIPARARIISMNKDSVQVEVWGVPVNIPIRSYHQSEDNSDYVCLKGRISSPSELDSNNIRCLFISIGS